MPFENRMMLFIASGLLLISSVLYITANALPIWGKKTVESRSVTLGLWSICLSDDSYSICTNSFLIMSSGRYNIMMAARAFITLSCILTSLSAVFILSILLIRENFKKIISMFAKILCIGSLIGGILGITLGIIFVVKKDEIMVAFDISVSSILAIIAVVFNLFGTIATLIINRHLRATPKPDYDSDGVNNN